MTWILTLIRSLKSDPRHLGHGTVLLNGPAQQGQSVLTFASEHIVDVWRGHDLFREQGGVMAAHDNDSLWIPMPDGGGRCHGDVMIGGKQRGDAHQKGRMLCHFQSDVIKGVPEMTVCMKQAEQRPVRPAVKCIHMGKQVRPGHGSGFPGGQPVDDSGFKSAGPQ
jgi:hypothetical protein